MSRKIAKHYIVRGRVQGVGFRAFVNHTGNAIGAAGWVRNLDDGTVEVFSQGNAGQLSELEAALWRGPRFSEVRGVTVTEAVPDAGVRGFRVR